ncbi:hypothetical protein BGZ94_006318 [Podila epigama]|nr:hypothetical protein BGZ94_006318 [Podila epigama]
MTRELKAFASIIDSLGPPRKVPSHPPKYRRASVAIIIRVRPDSGQSPSSQPIKAIEHPESLEEFFGQSWVRSGTPEILFIERATRKTDRWSGHVALPGGKQELHEDDQETAARETLEEIGLDLSDPSNFRCVGQLDDRELWTSFGRVFLMVLSPFVYIQLTPTTPPLRPQPDEVAAVHWQPLSLFLDRLENPQWTPMVINLSSNLTPRLSRTILRGLFGTMSLHAVEMPYKPEFVIRQQQEGTKTITVIDQNPVWDADHRPLKLWGLTLQMIADLLEIKDGPVQLDIRQKVWDSRRMRKRLDAGFLPGFSQTDMHFWVRALLKFHSWQGTEQKTTTQSNRVGSWENYYRLVKQAFFFVIFGRVAAFAVFVRLLKFLYTRRRIQRS